MFKKIYTRTCVLQTHTHTGFRVKKFERLSETEKDRHEQVFNFVFRKIILSVQKAVFLKHHKVLPLKILYFFLKM